MRLFAFDFNRKPICRRHHRAAFVANRANRRLRIDVISENRVNARIVHHAFFDHQRRAAFFARGRTFFGWLKNKHDGSTQFRFHARKHLRRAEQHRHVRIVSAGVHDADLLTVVLGFFF